MRILIVDDRTENLCLLEALLKGNGHEVVQAHDGVEALEELKEGPVDLIVSDILMPRMDGFQLCREVKKNDQLKKIAFIFYTATYVDKKDEAFALSLGAEKFMVKPTEPEVFLKILEEVVHNYQQGATNPPGEPMEEEEAYLTQYNSRLIKKLEKKMLDLEGLHGQLKISEEKYRTVVEGANEAILVAQEDRVTYVNPKALDLFGYSKEEIISRLFVEFIHLEDRAMVQDSHQRRVAGNHITPIYSFRIISRNGLIKWVEIHSQRIFWEGKPATLNFLTDITGRREAEEALQASERKYRKLHESMRDGFVSVSMDGRITEYNEAYLQMLGYEPEEIVTRTYMDLTPEKWQVLEAEIVEKQVLPRGYSDIYEKEYRRQDGQIFPVELRTFLLRDEVGNPSAMWAIVRDITERKKAEAERTRLEEQFQQAQKMESIGYLAGGVAHDFNNLLSAILGNAELLLSEVRSDDPRHKELEEILQSGKRAADLTRQLLAFSRKQIIDLKPEDLRQVLKGFEKLLGRLVREDIRIEMGLPENLGLVQADAGQIEQVLMNLAVNAQGAMPEGGTFILELTDSVLDEAFAVTHPGVTPGNYVLLAVSDTGCGMDQETLKRIFDPFFTTKEVGKGTGLGLSTVYGIVKQHGGHIWVNSEPGQGTTFRIYLPRTEERGEKPEVAGKMTAKAPGGTETILVVEDDQMVRKMIVRILERQGYRVMALDNPEQVVEMMKKNPEPINLLLTDVIMPGLNGRQLYERLAGLRPGLKVLYMSGYTNDVIAHHGVIDKGVLFIQKPFSVEALAQKVREALDSEISAL